MVHGTLLTEGSTSVNTLDSCTVQETPMADGSASVTGLENARRL